MKRATSKASKFDMSRCDEQESLEDDDNNSDVDEEDKINAKEQEAVLCYEEDPDIDLQQLCKQDIVDDYTMQF